MAKRNLAKKITLTYHAIQRGETRLGVNLDEETVIKDICKNMKKHKQYRIGKSKDGKGIYCYYVPGRKATYVLKKNKYINEGYSVVTILKKGSVFKCDPE